MNSYDPDWLVKACTPVRAWANPLDADVLVMLAILAAGCALWLANRLARWVSK